MASSTDPDINYSLTITYSAIEVNLAIWAASIPAVWPLIRGRASRHGSGGTYQYSPREEYHRTGPRSVQTTCHHGYGTGTQPRDGVADLELNEVGGSRNNTVICRALSSEGSEEDILGSGVDRRR